MTAALQSVCLSRGVEYLRVLRNTERPEEIQRRLHNARGEIARMNRYRYLIVNDDLELAFDQLTAIVRAEKQNSARYFPVVEEE